MHPCDNGKIYYLDVCTSAATEKIHFLDVCILAATERCILDAANGRKDAPFFY